MGNAAQRSERALLRASKTSWARRGAALALAALLLSCGAESDGPPAEQEGPLYTRSPGLIWSDSRIKVCFASEIRNLPNFAQDWATVRRLVEENYGRAANLRFYGWDGCPDNETNYIFIKWFQDGDSGGTQPGRPVRIYMGQKYWAGFEPELMHEFMHALGFDHEFDRPTAQGFCQTGNGVQGTEYTPYDAKSIMNSTYCHQYWMNLSAWDVTGLRRVYGKKPSGELVNAYNSCLTINGTGGVSDPHVQTPMWECGTRSLNEHWSWDPRNKTLTNPAGGAGTLDVQGGNTANFTPTWNYEFNGTAAQQWNFNSVEIRGMGGSCLDVSGGVFQSGTQVQVWECVGNNNQKWNIVPLSNGHVRLQVAASTGLCASRYGKLAACSSSDTELVLDQGQIKTPTGNNCLDVTNGNPNSGTPVQSYGCWAQGNSYREAQEWNFRGQIHGLGGKCLDSSNGDNGSGTFINTCADGHRGQIWDYYF